uniref:Uncharacterized protein n=1 Tax=Anguilla anguilla TaxID=7936 RepID=A0A0E9RMI5_ANGAN
MDDIPLRKMQFQVKLYSSMLPLIKKSQECKGS